MTDIFVTIGGAAPFPAVAGVWEDITPPAYTPGTPYGVSCVAVDPNNRDTVYCGIDQLGMFKTTNHGTTWAQIGTLDGPNGISVDPANSNHIVAVQGVRGSTMGYWSSTDGGSTWAIPAGFTSVSPTLDVTTLAIDPSDWDHQLVGSHGPWSPLSNSGVLETTDGGSTWTAHAPEASWPVGSAGVMFLYDPANVQGNSNTWGFHTDGDGFWKSSNAGASWTKTSTQSAPHGATRNCYASDGTLYVGGTLYPLRSTNNGDSFTQITGLDPYYYYAIKGDGTNLYTQLAFVGTNGLNGLGQSVPYYYSADADGVTWAVQPGGQVFTNGPSEMVWDSVNRRMYSPNLGAGLWVMRTEP